MLGNRLTYPAGMCAAIMLTASAFGQVDNLRITEFEPSTGVVEVTNTGPDFNTVAEHFFCHRLDCLSIIPLGTSFDIDEKKLLFVAGVNAADSDVWLFSQGPFTDPDNVVHGLKYGPQVAVGSTPVATSAGLWPNNAAFTPTAPGGMTIAWDGFGFDPLDWYVDETPTLGADDSTTSGYVPTNLDAPSGFQGFESILLGDEFTAMTGWQLTDTANPGLFTTRCVSDVNGVVAPRPGSLSTRWLRIRDQSFLTNTLCSPAVTPVAPIDYTWEFYINNEQTPPSAAIQFPRLMIQHTAPAAFEDVWGIEFRQTQVLLVTTSLAGTPTSAVLFDLADEFAVGEWVKITFQVSFSTGNLIARANDGTAVSIPIAPSVSVDQQEFRLCYRGDTAGNRHTLLLDDVSIETGTVASCDGDVEGVSVGTVDVSDLLAVLGAWGACDVPCPPCPEDVANDDCVVDVQDLLFVLGNWGPCE